MIEMKVCQDNNLTISCSGARNSPRPLNSVLWVFKSQT